MSFYGESATNAEITIHKQEIHITLAEHFSVIVVLSIVLHMSC